MPRGQTEILNRTATATGAAGDTLPDITVNYRRKIDAPLGVSLTGFIATGEILTANVDVRNRADIFLWEDPNLNLEGGLIVVPAVTYLINRYIVGFTGETFLLSEKFDQPYQLRYGHTYVLLMRLRIFVGVPVAVGNEISLTPLGFENAQETGTFYGESR